MKKACIFFFVNNNFYLYLYVFSCSLNMKEKADKTKDKVQVTATTTNKHAFPVIVVLAVVVRLLLCYLDVHSMLERRVEITGPTSSWFRGDFVFLFLLDFACKIYRVTQIKL